MILGESQKTLVAVNDSNRYGFVLHGLKAKDFKQINELLIQGIRNCLRDEQIKSERSVLTVSALLDDQYKEFGVAISVPSVLGKEGILRRLPLSITETENAAEFLKSVRTIQESVHQIK